MSVFPGSLLALILASGPAEKLVAVPGFAANIPTGTLIMVGGGGTPKEALAAFIAAATRDKNHLIVIPIQRSVLLPQPRE